VERPQRSEDDLEVRRARTILGGEEGVRWSQDSPEIEDLVDR